MFITNSPGRAAGLERRHRQRGTAERVIADLKACGAANLPFTEIVSNQAWITAAATAVDVLAWTRTIGLVGPMKRARPKTIRYRLLHVAARITPTGRVLQYDTTWPWTQHIINALKRITKAFDQPLTVTTTPA